MGETVVWVGDCARCPLSNPHSTGELTCGHEKRRGMKVLPLSISIDCPLKDGPVIVSLVDYPLQTKPKVSKSDYFIDRRQVEYRDVTLEKCHACGHERFHHRPWEIEKSGKYRDIESCHVAECTCSGFYVDRLHLKK